MKRDHLWGLWAGVLLIGLGIIFLLGQFFQFNVMRYLWPVFILVMGAAFFVGMVAGGRSMGALAVPGSVIVTIGLLLFFQNLFGVWGTWAYAWALLIAGAGVGLVIFGAWSELPDLRRAGRVVITVGLILFFVFGLLFELGASLLGMRSPGGAVWAVLLILAGVYVLFGRRLFARWTDSGPVSRSEVDLRGAAPAGETISTAEVSGIRKVRFHALGDITILQGEREGLEMEASQAVRERIRTAVLGDTLEIRFEQDWLDWIQPRFWNAATPLRYTLYLRDLEQLDAAGFGNLVIPALAAETFELRHSGAGKVNVRGLAVEKLVIRQAGMGNIDVEGRAARQEVELSGTGSYHAGRLESGAASVHLSGVGSATIWARDALDARISGTGSIEYFGSPRVTQHVSGLGSVRRLGDR